MHSSIMQCRAQVQVWESINVTTLSGFNFIWDVPAFMLIMRACMRRTAAVNLWHDGTVSHCHLANSVWM